MDAATIAGWNNYLSVMAEVAATLTGLIFVAVSINLSRVLETPGLTGRAGESLMQLLGVILLASSLLIPQQPSAVLGTEILLFSSLLWLMETLVQIKYLRRKTGHPRYWAIVRIIQTQLANVPFGLAGILVLLGSPAGLYWLVPGFIFSLVAGVTNGWILLVEILR